MKEQLKLIVVVAVIGVIVALLIALVELASDPDVQEMCIPAILLLIGLVVLSCVPKFLKNLMDWTTNRKMALEIHQVSLAKAQLDLALVGADINGMFPVARQLLESGALTNQILLLAAQHIANQQPVQPVPHSISYAPHMISKNDVRAEGGAALPALPAPAAKNFLELFNAGQLPKDKFLMGYSLDDGQEVTATWKDLYSALIGGQSGAGKSTLIRNILAQSALQGGRFVVLDPHYDAGDESLGQSLAPLRQLMLCDVASNDKSMGDALQFVKGIGERRLHGQDGDKTPVVLVVDETTALLSRGAIKDQLLDVLSMIAQETRKVGVFAMCIGQNFKGTIMDTTARNSFVSMLSCRARKDVARVQSGNSEFADIAETLTIGQAVWMQPSGNVIKIAVPNTTQEMIDVVAKTIEKPAKTETTALQVVEPLHDPLHSPLHDAEEDPKPWVVGEAPTLDSRAARVAQLFKAGESKSQIIADVYRVQSKGGKAYMEASAEFDNILRSLIPG